MKSIIIDLANINIKFTESPVLPVLQGSRKFWKPMRILKEEKNLTPLRATNITMKEGLSIEELQQELDQLEGYTMRY